MGKFKKPEGGFYTEEEINAMREPAKIEIITSGYGGVLTTNIMRVVKNENIKEPENVRPRQDPDDKAKGLRREVGTKDARVSKSTAR